jgi:hypothetical protein
MLAPKLHSWISEQLLPINAAAACVRMLAEEGMS